MSAAFSALGRKQPFKDTSEVMTLLHGASRLVFFYGIYLSTAHGSFKTPTKGLIELILFQVENGNYQLHIDAYSAQPHYS